MMTFLALTFSATLMWCLRTMNPIKVSMVVLINSTLMFFFMSFATGLVWLPSLMLMLFMGGIIMMFMILSSILPNEKSMKTSISGALMFCLLVLLTNSPNSGKIESASMSSKNFLMSSTSFFLVVIMILFYFMASMSILSTEQTPMRSFTCYLPLIL